MARRQNSGTKTLFGVAIFLIVALGSLVGYLKFGREAVTERSAIEASIEQAKRSNDIKPEQEALLRVQLSILSYLGREGQPPASLDVLVPTFMSSVPLNPQTKKPFYYKRNGRQYVLRGSEEEANTVQVASLKGGGEPNAQPVALFDPNVFVNPNTLEIEEFTYDPTGKRDPFRPFDLSRRVDVSGDKTPLETYTLGQLRLTAVLDDGQGSKNAIVENEAGRGFSVKLGTKMGDKSGVVVAIEKDLLKVLETNVDFTGNENQNVVEMKLYSKPTEDGAPRGDGPSYSGKREVEKPTKTRRERR